MNDEMQSLLFDVPLDARTYADDLTDLDSENIPSERIPKIKEVMRDGQLFSLRAGIVLASWGDEDGFSFLENYVFEQQPSSEALMPYRLWNYDDTCTQILMALVSYWAAMADAGKGDAARSRLVRPLTRIIQLSNEFPFEISRCVWLVRDKGFVEYLPALRVHFAEILKHTELQHWKIADCAHLLVKFDPAFVEKTLALRGLSLKDFPLA